MMKRLELPPKEKNICLLESGELRVYAAAYRTSSKKVIPVELRFIGVGVIYSYSGVRYDTKVNYKFYKKVAPKQIRSMMKKILR